MSSRSCLLWLASNAHTHTPSVFSAVMCKQKIKRHEIEQEKDKREKEILTSLLQELLLDYSHV